MSFITAASCLYIREVLRMLCRAICLHIMQKTWNEIIFQHPKAVHQANQLFWIILHFLKHSRWNSFIPRSHKSWIVHQQIAWRRDEFFAYLWLEGDPFCGGVLGVRGVRVSVQLLQINYDVLNIPTVSFQSLVWLWNPVMIFFFFFFAVYLFLFFPNNLNLLCYSKLFCSNANIITLYVNVWRIRGCVVLWVCVCRECEGWEDALSAWRALLLLFPELFQKRSDRGASSWSHRLCASLTKNNQSLYARLSLSRL